MTQERYIFNMNKYPLKLSPALKSTIWGGTKLKKMYGKQADFDTLGETWELTVRPDGMCTIVNGEYAGIELGDYLDRTGSAVISEDFSGDRFPLLIKFLDANDDLSIQVHPDDEYSLKNEGELGKTEMWYILAADEGAQIVYGLKDGVTSDDFRKAIELGSVEDTLNYVTVHEGDVFFIPAGQVHALGKGIVVAEIQQNSNVTYRVYDYNRRQADGSLRQLHVKKAADVVRSLTAQEIDSMRYSECTSNNDPSLLAWCKYFKVNKHDVNGEMMFPSRGATFTSILCLSGNGELICDGEKYEINNGDSYFIPAGTADVTLQGNLSVIVSTLK